jgi:hypothetical protein
MCTLFPAISRAIAERIQRSLFRFLMQMENSLPFWMSTANNQMRSMKLTA